MAAPAPRSLSVSIVSFNTRDATLACIESVLASRGPIAVDVTVVDNASTDGSADAIARRFPQVRLIRNATNRYFSAAHNQALRTATGELVLILNSDTELGPVVTTQMVEFMDAHPEVGAATCLYVDEQQQPLRPHLHNYWQCRSLWHNFFARHGWGLALYRLLGGRLDHASGRDHHAGFSYVDVVSDTFLFARGKALAQVDFYDERMLLYATEDDLCRRLAQAGWRIAVNHNLTIVHRFSGSVRRVPPLSMRRIYRNDSIYFYRKHGTWLERLAARPLLHLAYLVEAAALKLGYRMRFRG